MMGEKREVIPKRKTYTSKAPSTTAVYVLFFTSQHYVTLLLSAILS